MRWRRCGAPIWTRCHRRPERRRPGDQPLGGGKRALRRQVRHVWPIAITRRCPGRTARIRPPRWGQTAPTSAPAAAARCISRNHCRRTARRAQAGGHLGQRQAADQIDRLGQRGEHRAAMARSASPGPASPAASRPAAARPPGPKQRGETLRRPDFRCPIGGRAECHQAGRRQPWRQ